MNIKIYTMIGLGLLLSFLIGYGLANNRDKLTYELYKYTNGDLDLTVQPVGSPADRVGEDQIYVLKDKIEIIIKNAEWSSYEPTGSMEPVLTNTANGLYIIPKGPEEIKEGDIIAYSLKGHDKDIVHRVIKIMKDEQGNYFYVTKGDANPVIDPELVPYDNVKRILFGVIY